MSRPYGFSRRPSRGWGWRQLTGTPDWVAAGGFLLFALAFYYPLVFLGRAVVDYDAFVYFLPQRVYLARALLEGRLPLWNPDLFLGAPFLANPQSAVLYPPSWLFVVLPEHAGYTAQLVLHTSLASTFMYAFARVSLGVRPLAAVVGGLAYGFGGFTVGQTGHINQLSAAAWLPATLVAYDRAVTLASPRWLAGGALALGLQVLAGHPQVTYMTLLALGLFGLVRAPWTRPRALVGAGLVGVGLGLLGGLIAAAQILPTLELAPLSIRGEGVSWKDAVASSLPSYLVPRALLPPYWLDVASTEYLGYVGVVPLTLGFLALLAARSRYVWFGGLLCFLALFLAPGENNGYYGLLFASLRGFDSFRVPSRWLFLWGTGAATLAALGAHWLLQGARLDSHRRDLWIRVLLVALVLVSGLAWQRDYGEPFYQRRTPGLWLALAGLTLAAGAVVNARRYLAGPTLTVLMAVAVVELWAVADWSAARQAPPTGPLPVPAAATWQTASDDPLGRSLSVAQPSYIPRQEAEIRARYAGLNERTLQAMLVASKWRETLAPNIPMQYGVRSADGYDGGALPLLQFFRLSTLLAPAGQARPDGVLQSRLSAPPATRLLDLLGVRYVLAAAGTPPPAGFEATAVGELTWLRRTQDVAPALFVSRAEVMEDAAALNRLGEVSFDPNSQVVLAPAPAAQPARGESTGASVQVLEARAEDWRFRLRAPTDGYLLQREAWYPGWRAKVDGEEVAVLRANLLFRAVPVPAGDHEVVVWFESESFRRGVMLSALAAIILAALASQATRKTPW